MRHSIALASMVLTGSAFATVTPTTLYGDSYIVTDGASKYAVMDVYLKCSSSSDIISSVFGTNGTSGWSAAYTLNNSKSFAQSNGNGSNTSWLPASGTTSWDSFVTCGNRDQASASTTLSLQLDTNWATGNGSQINNAVGTGGAGWYPAVGASTSTNPYCRAGYYSGATAGTAQAATSITGNGITAGQSLANYWMVGRFAIEVTGDSATNNQFVMKFAVAGKNNGTTTFTGATNAAGRFQTTLTFASIPAPGAAALVGLAGIMSRRRRIG